MSSQCSSLVPPVSPSVYMYKYSIFSEISCLSTGAYIMRINMVPPNMPLNTARTVHFHKADKDR